MLTVDAVNAFIVSRKAKGLSAETVRWYAGILKAFAENYPELPTEPEDIHVYLAGLRTGDERLHGYYRALKAFYRYLNRRLGAFPDPMLFVDPPRRKRKEPRPLTPEEIDQLLAYPHNARMKATLLFLADTGCRVSEVLSLTPDSLFEMSWGYFARITGKTGGRVVPVSGAAYHAISKVVPIKLSRWRFSRLVSRAFGEARVRGSGINLRHSFGSLWRGDVTVLQQIMGHSHISTTLIYRQICNEYVAEQHRQYTPLKSVYAMSKRMI